MQYEKVKGFLEDAKQNGTIAAGGEVVDLPGFFIRPTIVRDIKEGSRLVDEEQFGPVLPILKYASTDEAVKRANATTYGFGASVWSSDLHRAHDVAAQLEAGTAWINEHLDMAPHILFGGEKNSGLGVEFGDWHVEAFTPAHASKRSGAGAHASSVEDPSLVQPHDARQGRPAVLNRSKVRGS